MIGYAAFLYFYTLFDITPGNDMKSVEPDVTSILVTLN
jgi:hypothetical protein